MNYDNLTKINNKHKDDVFIRNKNKTKQLTVTNKLEWLVSCIKCQQQEYDKIH